MPTDHIPESISIAVVVPNYNHGRFLNESLSSIAGQTRPPDEVVIIDDGSTDDSVSVIERFLVKQPKWRLIRHAERCGAVKRLNEGVAEVHSTWVTLFGADDLLDTRYLEMAGESAAEFPFAGMVCGCVEIFGQNGGRKIRPPILPRMTSGYISPDGFRDLLRVGDNYFLGTATLYRRQVITDLEGFDERLGSLCDGFLARQIAARHGFAFIPEILGYWRMHGQNYSVATATDPHVLNEGIRLLQGALSREPVGTFPPDYSETIERRLRFAGMRLIALDTSVSARIRASQITTMMNAGHLEQSMLQCLLAAGTPGMAVVLAWLTIRLRPLSFPLFIQQLRMRNTILEGTKVRFDSTNGVL